MWSQVEIEKMYQAIFQRKSIRKFKNEPLPADCIHNIEAQIPNLVPLFPDEKIAFQILDYTQVKGRKVNNACNLVAYTPKDPLAHVNAGFMLQQMDLWLSSEGIGNWWHGLTQPNEAHKYFQNLPFAFLTTFGVSDEPLYRNSTSEFTRKSFSEITDVDDDLVSFLEPVRLAPSSTNRQPWFFAKEGNLLKLYNEKSMPLIATLFPYIGYLDAGIGLCHLWLAAKATDKEISFERETSQTNRTKKSEYICSIRI